VRSKSLKESCHTDSIYLPFVRKNVYTKIFTKQRGEFGKRFSSCNIFLYYFLVLFASENKTSRAVKRNGLKTNFSARVPNIRKFCTSDYRYVQNGEEPSYVKTTCEVSTNVTLIGTYFQIGRKKLTDCELGRLNCLIS
jgi:hypothetical protein